VIKTRVSITGERDEIVTRDNEFKALVRKRMEITGESYTQALRRILEAVRSAVPSTGVEAGPPPSPTLQRRLRRPWDLPESEFPGIVPVDTLQFAPSEQAAVAITGISAYETGFEIFVTRLLRPGGPLDADPVPGASKSFFFDRQSCQISLLFADGRRVISRRRLDGDSEPAGPILGGGGGWGSAYRSVSHFWVWPLPPKGPLEFVCQWPMYGIAETRVSIDAQLILDAAQRSVRLWPQDEG
jgi:hypothetical protein